MDRIEFSSLEGKVIEKELVSFQSDDNMRSSKYIFVNSKISNGFVKSTFIVKAGKDVVYSGEVLEIAVAYYNNIR